MWAYLQHIYHQDHSAQKFQLEMEISSYSQGNLTIEQFYSGFINIWSEYSAIVHTKVPTTALAALQAVHAESQRDQFLMKLRPEFEHVRADLFNSDPVPSLDICLGDLLREEQRLSTQMGMASQKFFFEPFLKPIQHKEEDRTSCSVSAATSLVTLLVTVQRKFVTIVRNRAISSKIVGRDLRIVNLKLLSRHCLMCLPL